MSHPSTDNAHGAHGGELPPGMGHHHVTPASMFMAVLIALLFLTFITVFVAQFDFGSANMLIAMLIASVKASLVIAIFMHVKWDTAINRVVFLSSFLFLALLFTFTLADQATRGRANADNKMKAELTDVWVHPSKRATNQ
jgi:cytochrome c oxidase subunit 4